MKPVNLNQLLFHPKTDSLSFFLSSPGELDAFLETLLPELNESPELLKLLETNRSKIQKIVKNHPGHAHGFFLACDLQGYIVLDHTLESYFVIGENFHVRPLLEELFVNPEFMLVNVSLYDIKVYRGDFQNLEIVQQYEFDQLPHNFSDVSRVYAPQYLGLLPYKSLLAIKTIAQKVTEFTQYQSLPVIVTGLEEMKQIFLRYFNDVPGVISHFQEDFFEKSCLEIMGKSRQFRYAVIDYYSAKLKERLKKMIKSPRVVTDLGEIIKGTYSGKIIQLVIPTEQRIWGKFNSETGEYVVHKKIGKTSVDILNELAEEIIRQGGKIQILGPHFFPQDAKVLGILKGAL